MNIKDLDPNSYKRVQTDTDTSNKQFLPGISKQKLNIKNLPQDSYTVTRGSNPFGGFDTQLMQSQMLADKLFSQKPIARGFENPLTKMDPTGEQGETFVKDSLPVAGAIAGGFAGGALGVPAGPAGVWAGGATGATIGGGLGEAARQVVTGAAMEPAKAAKTGLEYGALELIGGPLAMGLGKLIKPIGKFLAKGVIPKSKQEAERILNYKAANPFWERIKTRLTGGKVEPAPISSAETGFQKGLLGPESWVGSQAKREADNLWKRVLEPKIKASKTQHDMAKFFDEVENQIVKDNSELGRQADLKEALAAMREEYAGKQFATTEDIQNFKKGWAKFVPEKAYRGKPIAGSYREVQNIAAGKAREILYKELGDEAKQAYIDYGNLQSLEELGVKAIQEGVIPIGGTATLLQHLFQKVAVPVGTVGGQTIYKVGEGIELIGKPGARTVRDVVGTLGGVGRESEEDMSRSAPFQQGMRFPTQ